jgi:hypothetical protein
MICVDIIDTQTYESSLRINSLLLASFPWYTSLPMIGTPIAQGLSENHYALVRHSVWVFIMVLLNILHLIRIY